MLTNKNGILSYNKIFFLSYALLLVIFVNSGFVKSFSKAANFIVIDYTMLCILLLTPLSFILFRTHIFKRQQLLVASIFLLFLTFYLFSALYTSSNSYYIIKLFALTGIIFSLFFGLVSTEAIKKYFYTLYSLFTITAVTIYFILTFSNLDAETFNDFTGNSLVAGEMLGASVLMFYFSKIRYKYILIVFSFIVMIALGARGPLLFSLLILIAISIRNFGKFNSRFFLNFGLATALVLLVVYSTEDNELSSTVVKTMSEGFSRFELLFAEDKGESVNSRSLMISRTLEHIDKNIFFGTGVGSFGTEIYGIDFRAYPHNVPLEIWFESGVVAFFLFHLFLISILVILFNKKDFLLFSLVVYLYLNMNKSSSLEELRMFFLVTGLAILSINDKNKSVNYA